MRASSPMRKIRVFVLHVDYIVKNEHGVTVWDVFNTLRGR